MGYDFYTADVFTNRIFGGNQLAVFPHGEGLNSQQMQQIAKEFNFSETVFVFPPQTPKGTCRLRIFTPGSEIPFAGHPTIGAAHILASIGEIPLQGEITNIVFEEEVGPVPVKILAKEGKPVYTELTAAQLPEFGPKPPPIADLAPMLSLEPDCLLDGDNCPQAVSCGVPFLFIPLRDRDALGRAQLNKELWKKLLQSYWTSKVYIFTWDSELNVSDLCSRMFAPGIGVEEDPATGSAAAALAGYLGSRDRLANGTLKWSVEQGVEMGRPSLLQVEADKENDRIKAVRVGGASVLVCQGTFNI